MFVWCPAIGSVAIRLRKVRRAKAGAEKMRTFTAFDYTARSWIAHQHLGPHHELSPILWPARRSRWGEVLPPRSPQLIKPSSALSFLSATLTPPPDADPNCCRPGPPQSFYRSHELTVRHTYFSPLT